MMNKHSTGEVRRRRETILRIVREQTIHSQEELMELLRKEGLRATQPTLSRDIRELGLAKTPTGYIAAETKADPMSPVLTFIPKEHREQRLDEAVAEFTLSVERAGNLIVFKTPPAAAQPLSLAVDEAQLPGVLGSVAGDDTVFLAVAKASTARTLLKRFRDNLTPSRPARRARA